MKVGSALGMLVLVLFSVSSSIGNNSMAVEQPLLSRLYSPEVDLVLKSAALGQTATALARATIGAAIQAQGAGPQQAAAIGTLLWNVPLSVSPPQLYVLIGTVTLITTFGVASFWAGPVLALGLVVALAFPFRLGFRALASTPLPQTWVQDTFWEWLMVVMYMLLAVWVAVVAVCSTGAIIMLGQAFYGYVGVALGSFLAVDMQVSQ